MTTTPLPRTSAQIRLAHANDSITKLEQASADLEAEVQRFRDHLTKQNAELDELIPMAQKLEAENKRLREALKDIARQPEGDEDSAQAVARAALSNLETSLAQYEAGDVASAAAQGFRDGEASVDKPPQYPLPDNLYPGSKDWMAGTYAERVEWLHRMYEGQKALVAEYERQFDAMQIKQAEAASTSEGCLCKS